MATIPTEKTPQIIMDHTNNFHPESQNNANDDAFGFVDFMDEANFEQFMALIRGEAQEPAAQFCSNWDCDHILACQLPPSPHDLASKSETVNAVEEQKNDEPSMAAVPKKKADRSRTLISEQKRRQKMKEKLYALRSLVPYITKMDKASIIGDAIRYVQELQMKNNMLKAEVSGLESSSTQNHPGGSSFQDSSSMSPPTIKQIFQMEVIQVQLREFYVRIVCNKSEGMAALLYKALDSIGLNVQSSNLATTDDLNYLFTFTVNVYGFEMDIPLPNLELWIASAFCNQGFHFA